MYSYLVKEAFGVLRPCYSRKLGPFHFIWQSTVAALSYWSLRQWRTRRANIKSWIIASLCKKKKLRQSSWLLLEGVITHQLGHSICKILARWWESANAHNCAAISREYICLSGVSSEYFGRRKNPYIKEHIANFIIPLREIRKCRFLGSV